jgi:dihydrolipoamide dehydrogenase
MDYDLIVIGSGPGGYVAASRAGMLGKHVLLVEKDELGGVCANRGCIPAKSLLHGAKVYHAAKEGAHLGVHGDVSYDFGEALAWKDDAVTTLRNSIAFLEKQSHVDVVKGNALCVDAHHVTIGETSYETEHLLIATGSSPAVPPIPGAKDNPHVVTSDGIFSLASLPSSVAIVGGGVIGIEFASYFSLLGIKVDVIEMLPEILPMMDGELAKLMRRAMASVSFHTGAKVERIEGGKVVFVDTKGVEQSVDAELVLIATGRRPNLDGMDNLHLEATRKGIVVDEHMETSVSGVYAIGDVNGISLLAHSAENMAHIAVDALYGTGKERFDASLIPWAVYGEPEAAGCGLTEAQATGKGFEVASAVSFLRSNGRFLAEEGKRAPGMAKVVADKKSGKILGVHLLGPASSEMIWGVARPLTVKDLADTVFPHPSFSEALHDCAEKLMV